jgi:hypothetical protein
MTEYLALVFMIHLVGSACFLAGLVGTFADVRNRFRIAAAMLKKPPGVDDLH